MKNLKAIIKIKKIQQLHIVLFIRRDLNYLVNRTLDYPKNNYNKIYFAMETLPETIHEYPEHESIENYCAIKP